ncbi:hypothetical protein OAK38_06190 [Verrucomicrobia bacterium]|nr:hypothetical protein [Verrucomicrobiota bacterium]
MTFKQALSRLRGRDDWEIVLSYLKDEREQAIGDFQLSDNLDKCCKLARLAGEISALDRIHQTLKDEQKRSGETV